MLVLKHVELLEEVKNRMEQLIDERLFLKFFLEEI